MANNTNKVSSFTIVLHSFLCCPHGVVPAEIVATPTAATHRTCDFSHERTKTVFSVSIILHSLFCCPHGAVPAVKVTSPTAMERCFGVLYDVNVRHHGWPLEIPAAARSDRILCFTLSDVPISIWLCGEPAQEQTAQLCRPVFTGSALCRSAWAVFSGQNLPDSVWGQENFTWEDALATDHSQKIGAALASCANAVLTNLANNLEDVARMPGNSRNIRNTWRRKCTGVLREMNAAAQGGRFAVGSLDAWLRAMNVDNPWCNPKLKWQEFIRMAPAVPLVTLKPNETEAFFQHRIEYFLAACRRVMHQNVVYEMLANPILGHLVATVSAPNKTGGTRVWGDFRLLQEVHGVRHCPFWAAKLDSPQLVANYRLLSDQNWSTEQSLHEFWHAGRRVGCLAFSPDGRSMVMHFGAQDTFSQEYVFERGDRLYLIAFASVSSLSFEFASLSEAVRSMVNLAKFTSPLQQLMGKPMDRFINVLNLLGQDFETGQCQPV